jgi:two-component system phosphate regulon sensor histidine kinase PhoR
MKPTLQELLEQLPDQVVNHIQNLERMRQDFVANVSHELRTPLTVIHGYLELLIEQDMDDNKPWKKIFLQMQQQTLRMENLIENLLLLSRLETQEEKAPLGKRINVSHLLAIIVDEAIELSGDSQHQFKLNTDKNLYIDGHEEELRSLFSNIIFNAVKYTPDGGTIIINWQQKNKQANFSVQDSGIGIAAEHIPKLTERFYRVDPARSRSSGGTGLGLAIAKHVLIRHQAMLNIRSALGKGSLFTCIFPMSRTRHRSIEE